MREIDRARDRESGALLRDDVVALRAKVEQVIAPLPLVIACARFHFQHENEAAFTRWEAVQGVTKTKTIPALIRWPQPRNLHPKF